MPNSEKIKNFLRVNYLVLFFMFALFLKQVIFIWDISGTFLSFPEIIYSIVICLFTSVLVFSPFFLFKKRLFKLSLTSFFVSFLFLVDLIYYHYFRSIPSIAVIGLASQVGDVAPAVAKAIYAKDLLYFIDIPIAFLLYSKIKTKEDSTNFKRFTLAVILTTVLLMGLTLFCDRNSFFKVARKNITDNKIVMDHYGVLAAHFLDVYRNAAGQFKIISAEKEKEVLSWVVENLSKKETNEKTGITKGKNIILVQVESLQSFVVDKKAEGQEITPNINKFAKEATLFGNHYFQIGAGHTSDTDFVVNTSYYPLKDSAAFVRYGKNDFTSLAHELKKEGYSTNAYHGFNRDFWNRAVAFNSLGYEKFFSEESYPPGRFVNMGLDDETFLARVASQIKAQPKPSFNYVITLSNHYPFHLDEDLRGLDLTFSRYPQDSYNYLQTVNFTDRALGKFFDKLKEEALYDDSLIVLYGDHNAQIQAFDLDDYRFDEKNLADRQVPLFIKLPGQKQPEKLSDISSHIDIMPTILNLVGVKNAPFMFGTDLFSAKKPFYSAVALFDDETVIFDNRIFQMKGGASECKSWLNGLVKELNGVSCDDLFERKQKEQYISEMIVRYNLFNKIRINF